MFKRKNVTDLRKVLRQKANEKAKVEKLKKELEKASLPPEKRPNFMKAVGVGARTVSRNIQKYSANAPARREAALKAQEQRIASIQAETRLLKAQREREKYMPKRQGFGLDMGIGSALFGSSADLPPTKKGKKKKYKYVDPFDRMI